MITCSNHRGQSYYPISQFDCLSDDVPYLPVNKENVYVNDIEIAINTPETAIKSNTFLHKINLNGISRELNFIQIKSMFIFGVDANKVEKRYISLDADKELNNKNLIHYGKLNPLYGKIKLNSNKSFFVDVNIKNMLEVDMENIKKNNSEIVEINKIVLDMCFYKNNEEIERKYITLNILYEEDIKKEKNEIRNFDINNITNGSVAFCMDTGEVYKFDEEYDRWLKL